MLQTSISTWLQKPKSVCEPAQEAVQLEPQPKKRKPDRDAAAHNKSQPEGKRGQFTQMSPSADSKPNDAKASAKASPQHFPHLRPLPPNVEIAHLDASTLHSFRRLNSLLLEIPYPPKFYDETLADRVVHGLSLAAFWQDSDVSNKRNSTSMGSTTKSADTTRPRKSILVAGIRCRVLEPSSVPLPSSAAAAAAAATGGSGGNTTLSSSRGPVLYIATLATLSPYRGLGLAAHLLARVTGTAAREHGVQAVVAHVWERNEEGLAWYRARGFEVLGKEEEYYRRLRPMGAWVVRRRIGVADLLGGRGEHAVEKGREDEVDAVE